MADKAYADLIVHVFVTPDQLRSWLAAAERMMTAKPGSNCVIAELPIEDGPAHRRKVRIVFDQEVHPYHAKKPGET